MGAFAEEVDAEAQVEEIAEQKAVVVDMPEEDEVDTYAGTGNEKQNCTFYVLYVDDSFNLGYDYNENAKWDVEYVCQYTTGHNGSYNHSMKVSDIKAQKTVAEGYIDSDWKIVGWTKTASANPTIFEFKPYYSATETTATQTTYIIYIVAKKTAPTPAEVTYTVNYVDDDGTTKAAEPQSTTNNTGSATFTVSAVAADILAAHADEKFVGWTDGTTTYQPGGSITLTDPTTSVTLKAMWQAEENPPIDEDEYAFKVKYVDDDGSTKAADDQTATNTAGTVTFKANSIYEDVAAKHEGKKFDHWAGSDGNNYKPGDDIVLTAKTGEDGEEITLSLISTTYLTLTAVYTDDGGTGGGDVPTPPTPGEKVSEPGMIKTVKDAEGTDKTGEGAIGTRKPGDVIDFKLQTNVGEDMMWTKDENDKKVQRLTKDENGTWGGADYVLTITDTMEGPMTADWTTLKVTLKDTDITDAAYVTKTTSATGFTITIDCVAALNAGAITEEDIGIAEILVTYTATVNTDAADKAVLKNTATVNDSTESIVTGDVTNPSVTPPSTGGSGTRMFTIGGVLILAAACVLFAVSRKKAKD